MAEFDEDDEVERALNDDDDAGMLAIASDEDGLVLTAGITSHVLLTSLRSGTRYYINDKSSFRAPHTDQFLVRVALFNRAGARVWLGPFRDKGTATGYNTLLHLEAVWDDQRVTARSLVLWKSVNGGSIWTHWANA